MNPNLLLNIFLVFTIIATSQAGIILSTLIEKHESKGKHFGKKLLNKINSTCTFLYDRQLLVLCFSRMIPHCLVGL